MKVMYAALRVRLSRLFDEPSAFEKVAIWRYLIQSNFNFSNPSLRYAVEVVWIFLAMNADKIGAEEEDSTGADLFPYPHQQDPARRYRVLRMLSRDARNLAGGNLRSKAATWKFALPPLLYGSRRKRPPAPTFQNCYCD